MEKKPCCFIKSLVNLQQKRLAELFKVVSVNYAFYSLQQIHCIFFPFKAKIVYVALSASF